MGSAFNMAGVARLHCPTPPTRRPTTGGVAIRGRAAFKRWVSEFQQRLAGATNETLEVFANAAGDRVVSRWVCRGRNQGIFGLPADGRPVAFTGIALWRVAGGRLAECWVERAA